MELVVERIDCDFYIVRKEQPTLMIKRSNRDKQERRFSAGKTFDGTWFSAASPISAENGVRWGVVHSSEMVRVPLFSYTVDDIESLMGAALQLGAIARHHLPSVPIKMHLALGTVYEIEGKLQFWVGLAFKCDQQ